MKTSKISNIARFSSYVLAGVLVLLPFHAFLTVALAHKLGHYDLLRLWKEIILLILAVPATIIICKTPDLWRQLRAGWLFWCLAAYVVLHVALGVVALAKGQVNEYALVYAWIINLRIVLILIISMALAAVSPWLRDHWRPILLWPAGVVVLFGLLQYTVLPADFLQHFGYGTATITPYTTVDQKQDYVRVQSTLRGPNPFGAYLVLVIGAISTILLKDRRQKWQIAGVTLLSASVIVLAATYSRSAYVGAIVAVLAAISLVLHGQRSRRVLAIGLAAFVLVAGGAALVLRQNDHFENIFFHTDEHSRSPSSSNDSRLSALESGSSDVIHEPFGRGPGTAGPASAHNLRPARIAENYYLQIAQEVGWLGLGLFAAINLLVARRLWQHRDDLLARVLLASLAGLALINFVQHAWADDTLALIWWGLAGIAIVPVTPAIISSNNSKTDKKLEKPAKIAKNGKKDQNQDRSSRAQAKTT
jgi:O-antigen ligase